MVLEEEKTLENENRKHAHYPLSHSLTHTHTGTHTGTSYGSRRSGVYIGDIWLLFWALDPSAFCPNKLHLMLPYRRLGSPIHHPVAIWDYRYSDSSLCWHTNLYTFVSKLNWKDPSPSFFISLCLSLSLSLYIFLTVWLSVCLSLSLSLYLSIYLWLPGCLTARLSLSPLSIFQSLSFSSPPPLSLFLSLLLYHCLSLSLSLSLLLSLSLSLSLYLWLYVCLALSLSPIICLYVFLTSISYVSGLLGLAFYFRSQKKDTWQLQFWFFFYGVSCKINLICLIRAASIRDQDTFHIFLQS